MKLQDFKEGDIIMRKAGRTEYGGIDRSYVGEKMEFVGTDEGKTFLINIQMTELVDIDEGEGFDENWCYYPQSLYEKAKCALKKYASKKAREQHDIV